MFRNLLVPLDGTRLAETALPAAAYLAQTLGASLTLVHVLERGAPARVHGEAHLTGADEATRYLADLAARALPAGLVVERHVHAEATSDVARSIAEHVQELGQDLVVLCAHGRRGLRDLVSGPLGEQVLARARTPVLVLRAPRGTTPGTFALRGVLVPLDGREEHAAALGPAEELVRACGATLHLLQVVPTPGTLAGEDAAGGLLLPRTTAAMLDIAQAQAEEQLARRRDELQAKKLSVSMSVARGDPATAIARTARDSGADLVVLGTHGRAGLDAFWARSVADRVYRRTTLPLLLVPVA
jgi:nucleotide-binding universal stress UspA family protein